MATRQTYKTIITRFDGGMNDNVSPLYVGENEQELTVNYDLDKAGVLKKGAGCTLVGTAGTTGKITGLGVYEKSDGTTERLKVWDNKLYKWTGTAWSASLGAFTMTASSHATMVNAFLDDQDRLYISRGLSNDVVYWDGSAISSSVVSNLRCKFLEYYKNRLFMLNINNNGTLNPERVLYSAIGADTFNQTYDYFDDIGRPITGVKVYGDYLVIFTDGKMYVYAGDILKGINGSYGCTDNRSIQIIEGRLIWCNRYGVYMWGGSGIPTLISDKVKSVHTAITDYNNVMSFVDEKNRYNLAVGSIIYNGTAYTSCAMVYDVLTNNWEIKDIQSFSVSAVDNQSGSFVPLCGDSVDDKVYQIGTGTTYNGTAITSIYESKMVVIAPEPESTKNFWKLYVTYKPTNASEYLTVKYKTDSQSSFNQFEGTNDNVSLTGTQKIKTQVLSFPPNIQGKAIQIQILQAGTSVPEVYAIGLKYDSIGIN